MFSGDNSELDCSASQGVDWLLQKPDHPVIEILWSKPFLSSMHRVFLPCTKDCICKVNCICIYISDIIHKPGWLEVPPTLALPGSSLWTDSLASPTTGTLQLTRCLTTVVIVYVWQITQLIQITRFRQLGIYSTWVGINPFAHFISHLQNITFGSNIMISMLVIQFINP